MDNLVVMRNQQAVTTSLVLAETFEKQHKHVLEAIDNLAVENPATKNLFHEDFYENRGKNYRMMVMNRDGFLLAAMGFNGKKATRFKLAFIDAFNEMEEYIKSEQQPKLPQSFSEALRLAADLEDKNLVLKQQIKLDRPKTIFADAVAECQDSILIGELAKVLKQNGIEIGQKRLFEWLRSNRYLIKKGEERNNPTQRSLERGWFEIKKNVGVNPNGDSWTSTTTKVTGKGQIYFVNKFLKQEG